MRCAARRKVFVRLSYNREIGFQASSLNSIQSAVQATAQAQGQKYAQHPS